MRSGWLPADWPPRAVLWQTAAMPVRCKPFWPSLACSGRVVAAEAQGPPRALKPLPRALTPMAWWLPVSSESSRPSRYQRKWGWVCGNHHGVYLVTLDPWTSNRTLFPREPLCSLLPFAVSQTPLWKCSRSIVGPDSVTCALVPQWLPSPVPCSVCCALNGAGREVGGILGTLDKRRP